MFYRCKGFTKLLFKSKWLGFLKALSSQPSCVGSSTTCTTIHRLQQYNTQTVIPSTGIPLHKKSSGILLEEGEAGQILICVISPCLDSGEFIPEYVNLVVWIDFICPRNLLKIVRICKMPFFTLKISIMLTHVKGEMSLI